MKKSASDLFQRHQEIHTSVDAGNNGHFFLFQKCPDHTHPLPDQKISMNVCLEKIKSSLLHFKSDSVIDLDQLKADLVDLGYERVGQVELPGQFSVRGGIIDIYPLTEENPWRQIRNRIPSCSA